ncbi:MAG: radical SAM protein [bacterium]|nr:radical SAM protein [bacterium]
MVYKTKKRVVTRRAVMWMGQTCNLRCYFCYFVNRINDSEHPEHAFMRLDKAKAMCKVLRDFYDCAAIDIQGGEPTIHPDILELITYCDSIGLYPTLITNGLRLARPGELEEYKEAGVRDFLVSLHGIGEIHDKVVGREGAYEAIITSIERMRELEIPFRFNCTMSEPVIPLLPEIAQKAIDYGARAMNFIAFNPFGDQQTGGRVADTVPRYGDIREPLTKAQDMLDEAGIECNVRYLPLCFAEPRHRKNFYNYQQLSYDIHEWDYASWLWTMMQPQMMREGGLVPAFRIGAGGGRLYRRYSAHGLRDSYEAHPLRGRIKFGLQHILGRIEEAIRGRDALYRKEAIIRAQGDCGYQYHGVCQGCALKSICDGFHGDYAEMFGTDEATCITDVPPVTDPKHFINDQEKIVDEEDKDWAL